MKKNKTMICTEQFLFNELNNNPAMSHEDFYTIADEINAKRIVGLLYKRFDKTKTKSDKEAKIKNAILMCLRMFFPYAKSVNSFDASFSRLHFEVRKFFSDELKSFLTENENVERVLDKIFREAKRIIAPLDGVSKGKFRKNRGKWTFSADIGEYFIEI